MNDVDIVVIGGGQSGQATSHALIDSGLSHVVLDAGDVRQMRRQLSTASHRAGLDRPLVEAMT